MLTYVQKLQATNSAFSFVLFQQINEQVLLRAI